MKTLIRITCLWAQDSNLRAHEYKAGCWTLNWNDQSNLAEKQGAVLDTKYAGGKTQS
jgi:hypothetical protein